MSNNEENSSQGNKNLSFKEKLALFQNLASNTQQQSNYASTTSKHSSTSSQDEPNATQDQDSLVISDQKQGIEQITNDNISPKQPFSSDKDTMKEFLSVDINNPQPLKQEQINLAQKDENFNAISVQDQISPQKSTNNKLNEKELKEQEEDQNETSQKADSENLNQNSGDKNENMEDLSKTIQYSNEEEKEMSQEIQRNDNLNPKTLKRKSAIKSLDNILSPSFREAKDISDSIVINFSEEEKVKNRMDEIRNGILKSTTIFDMKYLIVLKNSFVSFLKAIILDTIRKSSYADQPNIASKIYFFKTKEMSNEMEKLAEFVYQAYEEKNGKIKDDSDENNSEVIIKEEHYPILYVMTEKESFKEVNIQITSENDLNSKIPQDF